MTSGSSGNINIRRDVSDSFYRYKMPRLQSKIEGRGNGIKTVIPNMSDIAKALSRPPTYPTKFFGCELGAQVKCDEAKDRYIVNGAHDAPKLQSLLDGFITRFVLCGSCSNPETDLLVNQKDGTVTRDCKACGVRTPVDLHHKLVAFIVKNPPPVMQTYAKQQKGGKKKLASAEGVGAEDGSDDAEDGANGTENDQDGGSDDELTRRIEQEAAQLGDGEQLQSSLDDWSTPVETEELGGLSASMARRLNMAADGDDDFDEDHDPFELLAQFVQDQPSASDGEIMAEMERLGVREDKAVAVLVQVLLTEDALKQLPERKALFQKLIRNEKGQKAFLGGLERLAGVSYPDQLLPRVPLLLKFAYDEDLVEEEVMIKWAEKASKKYVSKEVSKEIRKKAAPFIDWLKTAEEEEEESSEED